MYDTEENKHTSVIIYLIDENLLTHSPRGKEESTIVYKFKNYFSGNKDRILNLF